MSDGTAVQAGDAFQFGNQLVREGNKMKSHQSWNGWHAVLWALILKRQGLSADEITALVRDRYPDLRCWKKSA